MCTISMSATARLCRPLHTVRAQANAIGLCLNYRIIYSINSIQNNYNMKIHTLKNQIWGVSKLSPQIRDIITDTQQTTFMQD